MHHEIGRCFNNSHDKLTTTNYYASSVMFHFNYFQIPYKRNKSLKFLNDLTQKMDLDYNPSYRSFIFNNKWVATVASIWIQTTSGYGYTFGIYSQALKASQHYDQSTLDTVAVFKDLGANLGTLAGLLYSSVTNRASTNVSPGKNGPWVVFLAGSMLCFVGFIFMWLSVVGILPRPPVPLMCFYMFLATQATTFFNTADVVTAVHNFPDYKGTSVGIMKGFVGLSGAILIQFYLVIMKNKPASFLLILALLPSTNALLLMWFVRIFPTNEVGEKKYLDGFSLASLIIATYLMAVIIIENTLTLQLSVHVSTFVVLLFLLLLPLYVAIKAQKEKSYRIIRSLLEQNQPVHEENQLAGVDVQIRQHPEGYHEISGNAGEEMNVNSKDSIPETVENLRLLQAMCTINFWLLFLTSASGMGSGLATINNISQIGESLGYSPLATSTLISLWSIWNYLGRFGAGYVSDYVLHTIGWSRPLFIFITLAIMSIGHAVIASGFPGALYVGFVLVGICYGSQFSLMPTIAAEIFGSAHLGAIFNTITIASPISTYILSVRVVGYIYDKEASGSKSTCTGTHCFMLSFLIMAFTTLFGSIVALILFFRTRNFYKQVRFVILRHHSRVLARVREFVYFSAS